jgi:putative peptidoglycan lipid II flippase
MLSEPLTDLLFRRGAFDEEDALQTARMIGAYGVGVWAYSALLIVHRGFYALGDRTTPIRIGVLAVVCNLVLSFTLIWAMGGQGLALATAFSAMLQVLLVTRAFRWKVGSLDWPALGKTVLQTIAASLLMAAVCWGSLTMLQEWQLSSRLLNVVVPVGVSLAAYFAAAWLFKMQELAILLHRKSR